MHIHTYAYVVVVSCAVVIDVLFTQGRDSLPGSVALDQSLDPPRHGLLPFGLISNWAHL